MSDHKLAIDYDAAEAVRNRQQESQEARALRDRQEKLHVRLFEARKAAEVVEKSGHNADGNFDFAKHEDVLAEATKQLEKQHILVVPQVIEEQLRFSRSGFVIASVVMEFQVVDTKDGGALTLRWSGTGYDSPGDKALFTAQTGCEKYFLAKLLSIPFGRDPEDNEASESAEARRVRQQQDQAAEAPQASPSLDEELEASAAGAAT